MENEKWMENESVMIPKVHWSFWLVSGFALLWNVGGSINYLMQTNMEFVSTLPETHRAIIDGRPLWATGGFAVAVFGGALGGVLLLLKKSMALPVFVFSLLGVLITMIHTAMVAASEVQFSFAEIFVMMLLPIIVAAILIGYTRYVMGKQWIA